MVGNQQAAALADAMQADCFRAFLSELRADLESDHAKLVRRLTAAQLSGDLRAVVRMIDALNMRFPGAAAPRTG